MSHVCPRVLASICTLGLASVVALGAGACAHSGHPAAMARTEPAAADHDEDNDPSAPPTSAARLTQDQATAIARASFPGDVVEAELEREHGHLIYSIEIRPTGQQNGVKEVNVDAIDGSIVNVEDEDDEDDEDDADSGKDGDGDGGGGKD